MTSSLLFNMTTFVYLASMLLFFVFLAARAGKIGAAAMITAYLGLLAQTVAIALLGMAWAQLGMSSGIEPLVPALQSNWLLYHVITCFLGYAAFAVACGIS